METSGKAPSHRNVFKNVFFIWAISSTTIIIMIINIGKIQTNKMSPIAYSFIKLNKMPRFLQEKWSICPYFIF